MAQPKATTTAAPPDAAPDTAPEASAPSEPISSPADASAPPDVPAGPASQAMILGWVDHEIDSAPDQNGNTTKIKVHSLGLVPAK